MKRRTSIKANSQMNRVPKKQFTVQASKNIATPKSRKFTIKASKQPVTASWDTDDMLTKLEDLKHDFWTRLNELAEDIEDIGFTVNDYNDEYVDASYDDGDDVYLMIKLDHAGSSYVIRDIEEVERIEGSTNISGASVEELQKASKQYQDKANKVGKQLDDLQNKTKKRFGFGKKPVESANYLPGPGDYNPPEYDEPNELEMTEEIEIELDNDITINEDGSWDFDNYDWANGTGRNGSWPSEEYPNITLGYSEDIMEYVDDMLESQLPDEPGQYHISGTATLVFTITNVFSDSTYYGNDEDGSPIVDEEVYTDDADVEFDFGNSYFSNFDFELTGAIESATNINAADTSDVYDEIQEIGQEFTSENTSINSTKLPAIFNMVNFQPNTVNIDYGGGKFDNVADYLTQFDVVNLVYDPYNRSAEHNKEVVQLVREHGGADTATCSNVLNVIKEPEVRLNVLKNISKLVKSGGEVYITVYEGSGKGNEGPTKSGYQLNRKTADYLEEIQQVFPDAKRKGKLITATNSGSVSSASVKQYDNYYAVNHGPQRFGVHSSGESDPLFFECQVSEIHPYDDAEYTWAKMGSNKQVQFIRDGKIQDKMQMHEYEPDDYESVENYYEDIVDSICTELMGMNADVKPIMIHN